ncbi:MAG: lipopolysaccharide biosynthesis protein [Gammaproteobacteria bacterium]|nr:lipopolysaccharide biosynthesis protein [Gammaproteobacteria bacterium]
MTTDVAGKTKKSLYWNVSLKIPYEIFKFIMSIATARILDPSDFGIVSIATFAIYYSNSFTNFGFNQALIQRSEITDDHINSVFTFDLVISILLSLIIFFSSEFIAEFFNSPESNNVIKVLSVIFIITTLHDLPYVLMKRDIEFKVIAIVDMLKEVSMAILTFALAYAGLKYWSIVWGQIIPLFFSMLYLLFKMKRRLKIVYHHEALKELFNFSIWSFVNMQISFIHNRIDRIVIGKGLNVESLGIYEKSKALIQMPSTSIVDNITAVLFSSFSRAQNDSNEIKKIFTKGLVIISIINFPIFFGIYSLASHFVLVLLGDKWIEMIMPLQILSIFGIVASINGLLSVLAISTGYYKEYVIKFTLSTILLVFSSVIAVDYGLEAVGVALIISTIILFVLSFRLVNSIYMITWKKLLFSILPSLLSCLVMVSIIEVFKIFYLTEINLISFFSLVVIGIVSYSIALLVVPSTSINDIRISVYRDLSKQISKIIRPKN